MPDTTVSAIYPNYRSAIDAIKALELQGIGRSDVSILATENSVHGEIKIEENSKAPEGAMVGGGVGGVLGAAIGGLAAVGTITATGGLGLVAAGPIISALAGGGAGAAVGGLVGGLVGMGLPETEAKLVDEKMGKGYVMLGVTVDDQREQEVREIMGRYSPDDMIVH